MAIHVIRMLHSSKHRSPLRTVRIVLCVLITASWLCGGFSVSAQGTGPGLIARIYTATSLGPVELFDGEVFAISKFQWQEHRKGEDGVTIQQPGDDYIRSYPVRLGSMSIPVNDLLQMRPPDPEKDVFTLLLRAQVDGEWINAWWTFSYAEWQRNWDSPLLQYVYVYPKLDLWTERDGRYNVADGVDKQVFVLETEVDVVGRLIVHPDRDPVILVHGIHGEDGYWHQIPQQLRNLGHDVWQFYYPGDQNIRLSAGLLAEALQIVLDEYPGHKVNLVGHSMGGLVTRAYLEELGLLAIDEQNLAPPSAIVQYRNDVQKWVSLGTPHHGMYAAVQFVRNQYDNPGCKLWEQIKELFREDYRAEPAYKQLALGSLFMWDLNQAPFPPGLSPNRDLLSIIGTRTPLVPAIQGCLVTDSLNDGAIDLISASLLDRGIPLVTLSKNHGSIVGHSFPLALNENRDTSNVSDILDRFFRNKDYDIGKEDTRIIWPDQDPYSEAAPVKRRAGLVVRYVDKKDRAVEVDLQLTDPVNPNSPLPPLTAWNPNDSSAESVPDGPPLGYGLNADLTSAYAIGVVLGSDSHKTFTLTANGRSQSVELQSGHFKEITICEDTTPLHLEPDPPQITYTGLDEVTVTWKTNRPATSEVRYGITDSLELRQTDRQLVTQHRVRLTNLIPYQTYTLQVLSASECGGQVESGRKDFRPGEEPQPPIEPTPTMTVLVFDVSGSMDWRDPSGKHKIEAARDAALLVTRMIRRENERQGTEHEVGIVAFTNNAWTLQPLTSEIADVERAIARLEPQSGTNLAAGLIEGARLLQAVTTQDRRILILLSDGVPTVYLDGRGASNRSELTALEQEVLDKAVPQAVSASDCLYVIGFGDPDEIVGGWPSIDEDFLRQIVAATTCGGYYIAETADELANLYVQLRHESTGTVVGNWSGTVAQGETTLPVPFDVPPNQSELHVTLNWPGSRLDLILTDPQRQTVDDTYPGATLFTDEPPVYAIVRNPVAGTWQAQVYGADVPQGTTDYNLIASTRSAPVGPTPPAIGGSVWTPLRPGGRDPIILLMTLLTAIGAALVIVAVSRRPLAPAPPWPPPPRPFGTLHFIAPGQPSRTVFLSRLPFTIGRRRGCDLVLSDPQASRTHARISAQDGAFVLEDLGSTNGTFVNDQRVQRQVLRPGDEIQIGQTRLRFSPEH